MNQKLYACKTCGQMIAKKAKKCPFCGAKNHGSCMGRLVLCLIIAIILFAVLGNTAPSDSGNLPDELSSSSNDVSSDTSSNTVSVPASSNSTSSNLSPENSSTPSKEPPASSKPTLVNGMRPEFKKAMDDYEAFYDDYCAFMKKYYKNPSDLTMIIEYGKLMEQAKKMDTSFEKWDGDMNHAESQYYIQVSSRVAQKLNDLAYSMQ